MKKILAILFGIMIVCSICNAGFKTPDPNRWTPYLETSNRIEYIDMNTIMFSAEADGIHATHWIQAVPKPNSNLKYSTISCYDMNLTKRLVRLMSLINYDANDKVKGTYTYSLDDTPFSPIAPGTILDVRYEILSNRYNRMSEANQSKGA